MRPVVPAAQDLARGRFANAAAGAGDHRRALPVHARPDDPDPQDRGPAAGVVGVADQQLGRVPRRLIWDNEPGIGRGQRRAEAVAVFAGHVGDQAGAAAAEGSGVQGGGRATQRVLRDLVHARSALRVTGRLQRPVQRLADHGERPGRSHPQGPPGRLGARSTGRRCCRYRRSAAASGLAQS